MVAAAYYWQQPFICDVQFWNDFKLYILVLKNELLNQIKIVNVLRNYVTSTLRIVFEHARTATNTHSFPGQ